MRGIPGPRGRVVPQAAAVVMADHGGTLGTAPRPIAASPVLRACERGAIRLRAGEDVVPVGAVASAVDDLALLGERGLLGQVVGVAVQLVEVARDHRALGIPPRPAPDAI